MDKSIEQFKERLNKLPKRLRDFVVGESWDNKLTEILSSYIITDRQKTIISNELFLVLLLVIPYTELQKNISSQAGIDMLMSEKISEEIISTILQPISEDVVSELTNPEKVEPTNSIGESFEQIILNQARAMQPAREEGEGEEDLELMTQGPEKAGHSPEAPLSNSSNVPPNLPVEPEQSKPKMETPTYGAYPKGSDPYREPAE